MKWSKQESVVLEWRSNELWDWRGWDKSSGWGHPWQGVYDLDGHDRTVETEMAVAELLPTTVTKSLHLWQDSGGSHNRPSGTGKIEIWHFLRQQALAVGSNPETGVPIIGSIKQLQRKTIYRNLCTYPLAAIPQDANIAASSLSTRRYQSLSASQDAKV